jgi:membrane fusion protein
MAAKHPRSWNYSTFAPPVYLDSDPPHWSARGLAYTLILLFVAAGVASVVIQMPETVSSPFVLVPMGGTDPVRASRDGFVAAIHVCEGQVVSKGEPLFVIHSNVTGDRSGELLSLQVQRDGAKESLVNAKKKYDTQCLADREEIRKLQMREAVVKQTIATTKHLQALQEEIHKKNLELAQQGIDSKDREVVYRKKVHTLAEDVAERYEALSRRNATAAIDHLRVKLEAQRSRLELELGEGTLVSDKLKMNQLKMEHQSRQAEWALSLDRLENERLQNETALAKLRYQAEVADREYTELERSLNETVHKNTIRIAALKQELEKSQGNEVAVPAPCAGSVLRLPVKGTGAFVRTGDVLCELAGLGERLQAELTVPSAGVGRINPEQRVKLLYDAFPYQRYGVHYGTVRWVSPAGMQVNDRPAFRVLADVEVRSVWADGMARPLRAGMGGRADVVVGRRSLLSFIFEPLRQLKENLAAPPAQSDTESTQSQGD